MRTHHLAAAAGVLALALFTACKDDARPDVAPVPTEPAQTASALTPDASPNLAVAIGNQVASICKAYRKASVQAKADLAKNPTDADLQDQVKVLDEMIDDACN